MKINLQIESSYSKWIITSSSWVWYFLQKSSRTQPSDIPGGGAALPERCQGALMGRGTGADVEPPVPCLRWSFMQLQTAKSALGTPAAARHLHKAPWKQISTSSQTSVDSSAHKSKCQLLRCICHITAELLGNPPSCSYWGFLMLKSSLLGFLPLRVWFFGCPARECSCALGPP